ncbi:unnamed protein product [Moneuplotes crassus]|uniref:Uncharacterized protein n=1 Tax=Euplotes crassus TaxID=5936 RepID=A0AAD1XKL2_EUPCR|nr:unnamed protein product [Moneuplotes crassus]
MDVDKEFQKTLTKKYNAKQSDSKLNSVEKAQIYFVGPPFAGKTAIINRIVTNRFVELFHSTTDIIYKYETEVDISDAGEGSRYEKIPVIIVDTFPLDHPKLKGDFINDEARMDQMNYNGLKKAEMEKNLSRLMSNNKFKAIYKNPKSKKNIPNPDYAHCIVFVHDVSEERSLETAMAYYEIWKRSQDDANKSVLKSKNQGNKLFFEFWGNKSDMTFLDNPKQNKYNKNADSKYDSNSDAPKHINVSAMTNENINDAFKDLVRRICKQKLIGIEEEKGAWEDDDGDVRLKEKPDPWRGPGFFEKRMKKMKTMKMMIIRGIGSKKAQDCGPLIGVKISRN